MKLLSGGPRESEEFPEIDTPTGDTALATKLLRGAKWSIWKQTVVEDGRSKLYQFKEQRLGLEYKSVNYDIAELWIPIKLLMAYELLWIGEARSFFQSGSYGACAQHLERFWKKSYWFAAGIATWGRSWSCKLLHFTRFHLQTSTKIGIERSQRLPKRWQQAAWLATKRSDQGGD